MVREAGLNVREGGNLLHRGDVRVEIARELVVAEAVEGANLEPLVRVVDVDGQQAADVRAVDGAATRVRRPAHGADYELTALPLSDRVDETERLGLSLLADEMDLVPSSHERLGQ